MSATKSVLYRKQFVKVRIVIDADYEGRCKIRIRQYIEKQRSIRPHLCYALLRKSDIPSEMSCKSHRDGRFIRNVALFGCSAVLDRDMDKVKGEPRR